MDCARKRTRCFKERLSEIVYGKKCFRNKETKLFKEYLCDNTDLRIDALPT